MRLQRLAPALAAAITLAGSAAPASAFDNRAPEPGPGSLVSHSDAGSGGSSSALLDIGVGAVAGAAIGSLGLAALTRRSSHTGRRTTRVAAGQP